MSASRNAPGASSSPPHRRGKTFQAFNLSTNSDWLATSPTTAKAVTEGADCFPFPYVKGVFGTVVIILETVEISSLLMAAQLPRSSKVSVKTLKSATILPPILRVLQGVLKAIKQLHTEPRGFSGRFREVMRLSSTAEEISGYRTRIQELRLNFLVKLMAAIDTNLQVSKGLAAPSRSNSPEYSHQLNYSFVLALLSTPGPQIINNCPPPTRIFQGRRRILDTIQGYFIQKQQTQKIFLLHGLGGAGKTQIALKFIKELFLLHGNIIITSRNSGLCVYAGSHCAVSDMEEPDAVDLLLRGAAQDVTDHTKEAAKRIVKVLHYLPLAIIQAGAFISKSGNLEAPSRLFEFSLRTYALCGPVSFGVYVAINFIDMNSALCRRRNAGIYVRPLDRPENVRDFHLKHKRDPSLPMIWNAAPLAWHNLEFQLLTHGLRIILISRVRRSLGH
ncbi:hypothetical protein FB451DRAFT_1375880 [Mycena latifolia]|nr:hypothetical protein FB451DRAFT_1375880 [Mycena latifolia]